MIQLNEIKRMQQLAGIINESQVNEAEETITPDQAIQKAMPLASKIENRPTVLSGAMHKDVWYLPNGTSPEAQILNDANVNYLWSNTTGSGSLALSFESVFERAKDADLWFSPSYYSSFEALEKANVHYTKFSAFENKSVFTFANTTGKTGILLGNSFFFIFVII